MAEIARENKQSTTVLVHVVHGDLLVCMGVSVCACLFVV